MTVKKEVENEKVRYSLACGRLTLKPTDSRTVQLTDGRYSSVKEQGITLEREGGRFGPGYTRAYDPNVKADREIIDFVDDYIEEHPGIKNNIAIQLNKMGEFDPVKPFPTYDSIVDMNVMETMLINSDSNLYNVMKYELAKDEPRKDVINLIERLNKRQSESRADSSGEAIAL